MSKEDTYKDLVNIAYNKKSEDVYKSDKRKKWFYLASKILSDEKLFYYTNFIGKTILNIGCAPHPIDEIYFSHFTKKWIAADININVLLAAKKICLEELSEKLNKKIFFVCVDATKLPFKNSSVDIVTAFSTIEHISNKKKQELIFKEVYNILIKKGYFVITVPNSWNIFYVLWSIYQQRNKKAEFGYESFYSPLQLKKLLINNGFKIIKYSSNFTCTVFNWLEKIDFLDIIKILGYRMGYCARKDIKKEN